MISVDCINFNSFGAQEPKLHKTDENGHLDGECPSKKSPPHICKTQMPTLLTNHKFGCFFSLALGVPSLPLSDCPARSYWWLKCVRKWAVVVVIWPSVQRPGYEHTLSYEQRGWEVQVESIASASVEHE